MSMTREEALEELERLLRHWDDLENDKRCFWGYDKEAVALALSALRPVSREQVEKVWKGEWESTGAISCKCSKCNRLELKSRANEYNFCPYCMSPMTDEAVEMVMERLEALEDGSTAH